MTWLIITASVALALFLVAETRIGVRVRYSEETELIAKLTLCGLGVKTLYPEKKKRIKVKLRDFTPARVREREAEKATSGKTGKHKKKTEKEKTKQQDLSSVRRNIRRITGILRILLGKFFSYLRTDIKTFEIVVATGDAGETAIAYGAISQCASYLFAVAERRTDLHIGRGASTGVGYDFLADSSRARIDISFSLRIWQLCALLPKLIRSF